MALDVAPLCRPMLADPNIPLVITEGVRKGDAAASIGLCCVALLGVWNWRGTNEAGGKVALADFESIALNRRLVYLAFDSDAMSKPGVHAALVRLAAFLKSREAVVRIVYLPVGEHGEKQGLDDYLATGKSRDNLLALASETLRPLDDDNESQTPTGPYVVRDGCIGFLRQTGEDEAWTQLANFTAEIVEEITTDDGVNERGEMVITGKLANGAVLPPATVPLVQFEALRWVTPTWGSRAVVAAGLGAKDRLREAIQRLSRQVVRHREFAHPGWRKLDGRWLFLSAASVIGADGAVHGIRVKLTGPAAHIALPEPPGGDDLTVSVRTVLSLLELAPERIMAPLMGAVFRSIFNTLAYADLVVFLVGPSGVLKSELAAVTQRFFGSSFSRLNLPASWAATANFLERVAFDFKDVILVIDDFAPQGSSNDVRRYHATADRVIRGAGNSLGRGRMSADGSSRPSLPPRSLILATGEDLPSGHSVNARMIALEIERGDIDRKLLQRFQTGDASTAPALAMAAFVHWLAPRMDDIQAELPRQMQGLRSAFTLTGVHARTPDAIAALGLGWGYWLKFAVSERVLSAAESEATWNRVSNALKQIGAAQADHQASENPVQRFLDLLRGALASGLAHVAGPDGDAPDDPLAWGWREITTGGGMSERTAWTSQGRCIGWRDGPNLYLEQTAAYASAQALGQTTGAGIVVTQKTLIKRLDEAGLLVTTELATRNVRTVRKMLAGARRTTVHLSANVLSAQKPDQSDQPDQAEREATKSAPEPGPAGHVVWSSSPQEPEPPDQQSRQCAASRPGNGPVGQDGQVPGRTCTACGAQLQTNDGFLCDHCLGHAAGRWTR